MSSENKRPWVRELVAFVCAAASSMSSGSKRERIFVTFEDPWHTSVRSWTIKSHYCTFCIRSCWKQEALIIWWWSWFSMRAHWWWWWVRAGFGWSGCSPTQHRRCCCFDYYQSASIECVTDKSIDDEVSARCKLLLLLYRAHDRLLEH